MTASKTIVKVQLSLNTTAKKRQVLVYNENGSINWEGDANKDIIDIMRGEDKLYFYARMVGTLVELLNEAPIQEW